MKNSITSLAPIVLFVYNRPWHTQQTVEALQKNELARESELFIYSDSAKNEELINSVDQVREYIRKISGFKKITVVEREKNWGLANSIIDGVTEVVNKYGKVIILEDDLITSSYFLKFMNEALEFYKDDSRIMSVTGYNFSAEKLPIPSHYKHDVYLNKRCMSWGWATWKEKWGKVDWDVKDFNCLKKDRMRIKRFNDGGQDMFNMLTKQMEGKIDSWAIRFCYAHFKSNMFTLYPIESLVYNSGFDGSGTHCIAEKRLDEKIKLRTEKIKFIANIEPDRSLIECHKKIYNKSLFKKIKRRLGILFVK